MGTTRRSSNQPNSSTGHARNDHCDWDLGACESDERSLRKCLSFSFGSDAEVVFRWSGPTFRSLVLLDAASVYGNLGNGTQYGDFKIRSGCVAAKKELQNDMHFPKSWGGWTVTPLRGSPADPKIFCLVYPADYLFVLAWGADEYGDKMVKIQIGLMIYSWIFSGAQPAINLPLREECTVPLFSMSHATVNHLITTSRSFQVHINTCLVMHGSLVLS